MALPFEYDLQRARPVRPLWHAIRHGHLEACRVLIDAGGLAADSRQQEVSLAQLDLGALELLEPWLPLPGSGSALAVRGVTHATKTADRRSGGKP